MRALVVGLALAVGVVGGVQAEGCDLDGATLVSEARPAPRPGLIVGESYRVLRTASAFAELDPDPSKPSATAGWIAVEVQGPKGRLVIEQDFNPGTMPYASGSSFQAKGHKVDWSRRDRDGERRYYRGFDVYGGPLAHLTLVQPDCK